MRMISNPSSRSADGEDDGPETVAPIGGATDARDKSEQHDPPSLADNRRELRRTSPPGLPVFGHGC